MRICQAVRILPAILTIFWGAGDIWSISAQPKVIYGEDNRQDYYQVTNENLRLLSESTAIMVNKIALTANGGGFDIDTSDTLLSMGFCSDERFLLQPTPGYCSAFLVAPNLIVTAGHCISSLNFRAVVFGFRMESEDHLVSHFPIEDVYYPIEVLASSTGNSDWAVIRLDRDVVGRIPLPFRISGKIPDLQSVAVMGYPIGLPLKIAGGANVRDNSDPDFFVANTDTYGGNSGSAIINLDSYEVEGVLVRGDSDYVTDSQLKCKRSNVCPETGCAGEDCTRTTEWAQVVIDYINGTPTPTNTLPTPTPTATPSVTETTPPTPTPSPSPSPTVYDDHGNSSQNATFLEINTLVSGSINYGNDPDFFVFNATKDSLYIIETINGSLSETSIELFSADGSSLLSANSGEGAGLASCLVWTATETSVLFVEVEARQDGQTGSYFIRVSGPCPAYSNDGYLATDFNRDGRVDANDLIRFIEDFGTIYPTPTPLPTQ